MVDGLGVMVSKMTDATNENEAFIKRRYGNAGLKILESLYYNYTSER